MVASTFLSVLLALLLQSIYAVDHHTDFYGHVIEPQAVSRLEHRNCVPFSWTKKIDEGIECRSSRVCCCVFLVPYDPYTSHIYMFLRYLLMRI